MLRYKTKTRPGLVALYDIRPGNGAGPFLQPRSPHGAVGRGLYRTTSVTGLRCSPLDITLDDNNVSVQRKPLSLFLCCMYPVVKSHYDQLLLLQQLLRMQKPEDEINELPTR